MSNTTDFERFCGGTFWNTSLTWNTEQPDMTMCFQRTVLVWFPCGFLWIFLPLYIRHLVNLPQPSSAARRSRLYIAKLVMCICLMVLSLVDLIKGVVDVTRDAQPPVLIVSPLVLLVSFVISAVLIDVERRKIVLTSPLQFLFYLLLVVDGIVPFYSFILKASSHQYYHESLFRPTLFYITYALILLQFLLFCFAEPLPRSAVTDTGNKEICPEVTASFLSQITFHWLTGLILLGYKKNLEENDVWQPNPQYLTRNAAPQLEKEWTKEIIKCHWETKSTKKKTSDSSDTQNRNHYSTSSDEYAPLVIDELKKRSDEKVVIKKKQNSNLPSLILALARVFGLTLLKAHFFKFVCDLLLFVGPLLQNALISYTENDEPVWKGYFFSILFFVESVVYSLVFHQSFHVGTTLGIRVRAAIVAMIYKKALTVSNDARNLITAGEIVNLMSVDAQRLQDVIPYLWMVWSTPLQIAIAIYMLWNMLGISVLAGLAVMLILIPINGVIGNLSKTLQMKQMKLKDQRIKLMNEMLNGMKVLKLYAWEMSFQEKINSIRAKELDTIKKFSYLSGFATFTWTCAPVLVILATFATYIVTGGILDAAKAFTALSLFNILRFPMSMLPMMINFLVMAHVSLSRLRAFIAADNIETNNVSHDPKPDDAVIIQHGTFSWSLTSETPVLKNINLRVPDGCLMAVVGQVGVGKSSLISAILGEMEKLKGYVNVKGSIAYVAQQAWIQNASVRDNILFGQPYDCQRYKYVVDACALRADFEMLPAGDATEIGEKGINLSGGQKQRVSLARAIYQDCDLYLLDDPLSAVDSHVGKHIFKEVISSKCGLLRHKTRILVTHGINWLPQVDKITVIVDGMISETGSYEELLSHNKDFAKFLRQYAQLTESDEEDAEAYDLKTEVAEKLNTILASEPAADQKPVVQKTGSDHESVLSGKSGHRHRKQSQRTVSSEHGVKRQMSKIESEKKIEVDKNKIVQEEVSATGEVDRKVYISYCKSMGLLYCLAFLLFFILSQVALILSNVWLSEWTEDPLLKNVSLSNTSEFRNQQNFFLGIYGGLSGAQSIFLLIYAIVFALTNVHTSAVLHRKMLSNVLRSPMMFFETTPIGRILNRFSRDIETVDNTMPGLIRSWLSNFFNVVSTVVIISYSTPVFLAVIVPLFIIYYFVQRFYIPTTRQMKRIESTTRSPIYVHFSETISGSSTIRAYQRQEQFIHHSEELVDHNIVYFFSIIASNRWIGFRLEVLGAFIIFAAALFAVLGKGSINGGIVGLSISYALQVTQALNWMVRMSTDLETNIVSVERINEYSQTPTEADWHSGPVSAPINWPSEGQVTFKGYSTRYRPGLDLVLHNITVNIEGGEKVGIVGRTGAGKSSFTLALFRIIEAAQGSIIIDGIDVADLALYPLRSKLVILPQDPVLFSGTLRMNLDPFKKYPDDRIWKALELAHLRDFVSSLPTQLEYECGEGGMNLSVGQRQLLCLARALLRKTKILVLDEATAAVDMETDELIQKTIRQEFADCTVLTIAHRINTIMDSNRVMVLEAGRVREFDTPSKLLDDKNSLFYSLAKDAGLI